MLTRSDVAEHFLHIRVLVPELVHAWVEGDSPVPDVARMVDELVLHLHVRVLEPYGGVACKGGDGKEVRRH